MKEILKQPPYNKPTEQALIGSLLQNNCLHDDVAEVVIHTDFYNHAHRRMFLTISNEIKNGRPADPVTIGKMPDIDFVYCVDLARATPSSRNATAYAKTVKRLSIQRDLIATANEISDKAFSHCDNELELVADAERRIGQVTERLTIQIKDHTIGAALQESVNKMQELAESNGSLRGLSYGFVALDQYTNGLKPGTMATIAARPGGGKTTFALNIVEKEAIAGGFPLVFSIEMMRDQIANKMISSNGNVQMQKIMSPNMLDDNEWEAISAAKKRLKATNLEVVDNGSLTTDMIRIECRRYQRKYGELTLIMVDYVQIVKGKKSNNRTNEVDQISRDLLALAKEFDCPVLVLSQLSRDIEKRPDKTPLNSDLRESGQLEQDAEEIIFIHNEQEEGKTKPNDGLAKLIVSKCRNGRKGTVITEFQGEFSRFVNTNRNWASKNNDSKPLAEKFGR
jgi:replicative DNA helicase